MSDFSFLSTQPMDGVAEVEWLDFDYVNECKDIKIMEIIVKTLKLGTHGKYLELQRAAESKLLSMQPDVKHQQKVLCEVKSSPSVDDPHIAESELEQWVKMIDESDKLLRETSGVKVGIKNIPSVRGAVSTVNSNISTEPPHKITEMKSLNDLDQYVGNLGLASTSTVVGQGNIHDASSELKYNDDLTSKTPASFTDTTAPIDKVADHTGIDSTEVETFTRVQITEESDDDEEDAEDSDDGDSDDSSVGAEFNHRELALADEKLSRMYLGKDSNVPSASVVLTPSESPTAATPHINILDSVSSSKDKEPCPTKNNKDIITSDDELKTCAVALKEEGNRYKQVGDLKNALRCYTESVQLNPTLVASFNNRALVYIELKQYKEAISDCTLVLASEPSNCKALFRRAECFKQLAQYDKCESNLRSLLKIDPSNKQARALAEKVAALTDAIEATTTTVTNTTTATSNSCADTKKAVAEIPLELTVAETRSAVLRCLEQGRSSDAVALCSKTIADVQTASNELFSSVTQKEELLLSLQILQITSLYASGDYSGGVIVCDQILSIYPKHFRATLKKAEGQAKLGLLEEALNNALSAIDIEPRNSDANRLLKELRRQLGEKKTTELNTIRVTEKQATPPIQVSKKQDIAETTGRTTKPTESQVSNTIQDGKDKMRASTIKTPSALLRSVTECKDKGNQSVTKGDYPTALAAYSQAIVLCESSDVSSSVEPSVKLSLYYNRAHAFIKSSQYLQAQLDADTVIRETNKLLQPQSQSQSKSPVSTKVDESISRLNKNALYLKGLTLRNLGGDKLKPAEEALTELLSKDPQNASAKKELDKVRELLKLRGDSATKNGTSIKTTNNPTKSPSITSSSSPNPSHSSAEKIAKMTKAATTANTGANIGLTAVKTINKPRPIQSENLSTTTTSPVIETNAPMKAVKRTEDSLQELVNAGVVTYTGAKLSPKSVTTMNAVAERVQSPLTTAASVTSKMKPNVPPEPPKTVYELERICRGLKSHPDLFALYLSKFKSTTFKTAFKESVSPDLISSMLIALRDHCTEGVIVRVLTGFHSTDGFNMTIQVLPQGDIDVMNEIFMKLENTLEMKDETAETKDSDSDFTVEQLKNLRKMYKL